MIKIFVIPNQGIYASVFILSFFFLIPYSILRVIQELGNDKEAAQIFCLEQATIADGQGASENGKFGEPPTKSEPIFELRAV